MDVIRLDLHGERHDDARRKTIRFIEENWDNDRELEIITGHSQMMKGLVMSVLQEYGLGYNIGRLYEANASRIITWT